MFAMQTSSIETFIGGLEFHQQHLLICIANKSEINNSHPQKYKPTRTRHIFFIFPTKYFRLAKILFICIAIFVIQQKFAANSPKESAPHVCFPYC
jgi:hypothetical protein